MGQEINHPGGLLRELRKSKKMTLAQVSGGTGLSISHLSDVERGVTGLSMRSLEKWAKALGYAVEIRFKEKS